MENPRSINRFFIALLIAFTLVAIGSSLYLREIRIFLLWVAVIALFVVVCGLLSLCNIVIFAPIFRLVAKLDARLKGRKNSKVPPK